MGWSSDLEDGVEKAGGRGWQSDRRQQRRKRRKGWDGTTMEKNLQ